MATSQAAPPALTSRSPIGSAVRELLGQLSNFWFGMSLLGVWGFLTLIGVVVDQGKDANFYLTTYAPALARLVLRLHLDNIYHSPAYLGIVGFILACMTLATFWRVIPTRLPPLRAIKIDAIPLNASVAVEGDEETVRARVEAFFAARGWLVRKRELGGIEWTFADKHNWARRGVLVAHVGFVIIAVGTTLYWAFGYSGVTAVVAGSSVTIPESGALFKLDRFRYRIDPIATRSGIVYQPIDYVSDVHVTGKDGRAHVEQIRVNAPLDVDGVSYYQASYGFAVNIAVTKDGKPLPNSPNGPLKEGEGFPVGQSSRSLQYAKFVGSIGPGNTIGADPRPNNPGVLLNVFDGAQNIGSVLVPLERGIDIGNGYRVEAGRYVLYSGIQYRHDPGIPFVGVGAFVLLAGLCISFYFLPARLYVRVDGGGRAWNVGIAATTVKGYDIYEEQFAALVGDLAKTDPPHAAALAPAGSFA
ncbi:MAG: cytochrome c biogenesis protein ResB [Vulcanimicrobiaceae bacterium]